MKKWYEEQAPGFGIFFDVEEMLVDKQTDFQHLQIFENKTFGKVFTLDGMVMTTDKDEFVYHEMMAHVPLNAHPNPKNVLIIGGGDGGVLREVLKHDSVKHVKMVDIDDQVLKYAEELLGQIWPAEDPRAEIVAGDGFMEIINSECKWDVIIADTTEPVGPAVELFTKGFYAGISKALREDGLFVAQTDNPWHSMDLIKKVNADVKEIFPTVKVYTANVTTYPTGLWTITVGSKTHDPAKLKENYLTPDTKYYTPELHQASFVLPKFLKDEVE